MVSPAIYDPRGDRGRVRIVSPNGRGVFPSERSECVERGPGKGLTWGEEKPDALGRGRKPSQCKDPAALGLSKGCVQHQAVYPSTGVL